MSVSVFHQSVAHSSDEKSLRGSMSNAERSTTSSASQSLFWDSYHFGSAFGSAPSRPHLGHGHFHPGPPPRPLPDAVRPNPGPPPRPTPERPDPYYSKQSNQQLAQALLTNYGAFKGGQYSRQVTRESLQKMADQLPVDANVRLAKELLRRPDLIRALDRNMSTGASDGRLSREDILSVIRSDNPFKLKDDKELVKEMLGHFEELKRKGRGNSITLDKLEDLAKQPLTGNPATDHLIELVKEVMSRSILQGRMDNVDEWQRDGKISRRELLQLLQQLR
jgi:hypothetical protein